MRSLDDLKQQAGLGIVRCGIDGGNGVVHHRKLSGTVIWSFGGGWEHVSVAPYDRKYTPSWDDMCWLKDVFFYPDEWAVQFHPAHSEYMNNVKNCLHIWRPSKEILPTPPSWMVGLKGAK